MCLVTCSPGYTGDMCCVAGGDQLTGVIPHPTLLTPGMGLSLSLSLTHRGLQRGPPSVGAHSTGLQFIGGNLRWRSLIVKHYFKHFKR